jgi:peptidoglycan/LPS O-acetylase OafA/YrhL
VAALAAIVTFVLIARHFGMPTTEAHYPFSVLLPELFMVHIWAWKSRRLGWNSVDWSVSAEWFAYLFVFPVANLLLNWIKAVWIYLLIAALLLVGLAFPWSWRGLGGGGEFSPAIIQITLEFLAGAMVYGLRRRWNSPATRAISSMLGLAIGLAILMLVYPNPFGNALRPMLVACFGLVILALSYPHGTLSGFLSARVLLYLGEISYSLYLTHQIVQRILKVVLHPDRFAGLSATTRLIFFLIYITAIIGAAVALFHLVEEPCRSYLRKHSPFEKSGASPGKFPLATRAIRSLALPNCHEPGEDGIPPTVTSQDNLDS